METTQPSRREGSLDAPTRHAMNWQQAEFYDETALNHELERVFDICHGCRRCVSLCQAFPTLFDLVDAASSGEVDGVAKQDYLKVVEQCYLCDLCYMTKCPYVPPHEWNLDFPHVMLRAKAVYFKQNKVKLRDKFLSSTDTLGKLASIPVVAQVVNAANRNVSLRKVLDTTLAIHPGAILPEYHSKTLRRRVAPLTGDLSQVTPSATTQGKVALFATCYGNYNEPQIGADLVAVLAHNAIPVRLTDQERCCGMPKLELGDLDSVRAAKEVNIPMLAKLIDAGWDILAPVPSCVLMFKQELPLLFPDDPEVIKVKQHIYDPFEYLWLRHKAGLLKTEFKNPLGNIAYQVACHLRVQNIGLKTRDTLALVPGTQVEAIERCSGHNGTYAVKREFHELSMKIAKPVVQRVVKAQPDHYTSDCPMAGHQIENGLKNGKKPEHPITLLRQAYGI